MQKTAEQLKRFTFFSKEVVRQTDENNKAHAKLLKDISLCQSLLIFPRIFMLDKDTKMINIFQQNRIVGSFLPFSECVHFMATNSSDHGGFLFVYGEDRDIQSISSHIRIYNTTLPDPFKECVNKIAVGKSGSPLRISPNCFSVLRDMTMMAIGTVQGPIIFYQAKNLTHFETGRDKTQARPVEVREIKAVRLVRRGTDVDVYYSTEETFMCLRGLSEKKKLMAQKVTSLSVSPYGTVFGAGVNDTKTIAEFDQTKLVKAWPIEGEKLMVHCYKESYVVVLCFVKKDRSEKYTVQILDVKNSYLCHYEEAQKMEWTAGCQDSVWIMEGTTERRLSRLTEKDNAFKIQTFFKKKFYNQAYKFAQSQQNSGQLLAEISKMHGDYLYGKNDYTGAIKQYALTIGYCQPSYIIRKFLDVPHIEYLISYLQTLHSKKKAQKEHTALLLNCFVKQRKIEQLGKFLEEVNFDSNLFDVETAIKVCRQLKYKDLAMKLAEQRSQHDQLLRILIEDLCDYRKAIEYIKVRIPLDQKQRFLIEFGPQLMQTQARETLEVIKNIAYLQSLSLILKQTPDRMLEHSSRLSDKDQQVLHDLGLRKDQMQEITTVIFRRSDEYLRLFMNKRNLLQDYLEYLLKLQKITNEMGVLHRLFELYLNKLKDMKEQYNPVDEVEAMENKILSLVNGKKFDRSHLFFLFKIYQFEKGTAELYTQLQMHQELMLFYLEKAQAKIHDPSFKERQQQIIQLCIDHGQSNTNLWIHALKHFANPAHKGLPEIPRILGYVGQCGGLSPLLVLRVLAKHKNVSFKHLKEYFSGKIKAQIETIEDNKYILQTNKAKIKESKQAYKKLKTTAKVFQISRCTRCNEELQMPVIHFLCGHSLHENCLNGDRSCPKCSFEMNNKVIERKQTFEREAKDQKRLFECLEENKGSPFTTICEYMGKGLFPKQYLKRNI